MISVKNEGIILEKTNLEFENKAVLNPACIQVDGITHMFYRAINHNDVSSVGYCQLKDNKVVKRFKKPILFPEYDYEKRGIEDPRITLLEGTYYLLYTAYDGKNALAAYATTSDLINFKKHGVISPQIFYSDAMDLIRNKNLSKKYDFATIKSGLQTLNAPINSTYSIDEIHTCPSCHGQHILQETDTFDTWFLSGQWPLTTLGFDPQNPSKSSPDFNYFYPTSVLDTLSDILFFWVGRMQMFGYYLAGNTPFETIHLHAKVVDEKGQKMSKSKDNVTNPTDVSVKYGADALRMALVFGVAPASNIALSDKKIESMRNFVNKIWNASRFVTIIADRFQDQDPHINLTDIDYSKLNQDDKKVLSELNTTIKKVNTNLAKYRFGQVAEDLYAYLWHYFCDIYIEQTKHRGAEVVPVLFHCLLTSLKLLHPLIPFVTESIYQQLKLKLHLSDDFIATSAWPQVKKI